MRDILTSSLRAKLDMELGCDFYETAQGVRFMISRSVQWQVFSRLLRLNHERWKEEQKAEAKEESGKKKEKKVKKSKSNAGQMGLL
jgi:hypothetical protein